MGIPKTAAELNLWLAGKFCALTGANRAFVEFPMKKLMPGEGEPVYRLVFRMHGLVAPSEERACEIFHAAMDGMPENMPLIVRREFHWRPNYTGSHEISTGDSIVPPSYPMGYGMLSARLAFWDDELHKVLGLLVIEGAPVMVLA